MMEEAERRLRELGCPKVNVQVRRTNLEVVAFYRHLGYKEDDMVGLGKRLEHDDGVQHAEPVTGARADKTE